MLGKRKILTEVITPTGSFTKKFPIDSDGDHIVIRPARRGPGGAPYKAKFDRDCIIVYWKGFGPFKKLCQKLILIEGAEECIRFRFMGKEYELNMPVFDRDAAENFFKAAVIKAAGATVQKITIPISVYIILVLVAIMQFISLLILSGRVKIAR